MSTNSVRVVETGGVLPDFWERRIAFFANLLALFFGNEKETKQLASEVGELPSYGGRLIPILNLIFKGSDNVLVLERSPDEPLCQYFSESLRLSLPKLELMKHEDYLKLGQHLQDSGDKEAASRILAKVELHAAEWVDGYVTDETLLQIATHLGKQTITSLEGSRQGNNKLLLFEHIRAQALPFVATELAESVSDVLNCLAELKKQGFEAAVMKSQIGASGIGMRKIDNIDAVMDEETFAINEHYFFEGPCMVQGWLQPGVHGVESIRSPSVQMFLGEETAFLYDVTEQILSRESIHEGNISPPPYLAEQFGKEVREELFRQAGIASQWLHDQGYRGTASTDFLLVKREGRDVPEVYICEINARVTGATYPSVLARHFTPRGAWLLRNLRLQEPINGEELLAMLHRPRHLYQVGNTFGVLPINFNVGVDGLVHKGQFLCLAETPDKCYEYLRVAETDLPSEWTFDRD